MSRGVVDPNLDLQALASQALEYQAAPQQHQQPELQYVDKYEDPDAKFACPFPTCNRHYKRKDLLKRHLTTLLASPDEHHQDPAVWEAVREEGTLTIYTRPRNLSDDQKKQRRKDSNLRHRIKYAEELREKRNRKRRVEKLLEGRQVGVQTPDWEAEGAGPSEGAADQAGSMPQQYQVAHEVPRGGRRIGKY
jgi:hypothetical protein